MVAERVVVSKATQANLIAILTGASQRLNKGWNQFWDALDSNDIPCSSDSPSAVSWSMAGAIGSSGQALGLFYGQGSYELLNMVYQEIDKTKRLFKEAGQERCEWTVVFETLDRVSGKPAGTTCAELNPTYFEWLRAATHSQPEEPAT